MAFAKQRQQGRCMGEQIDPHCDMEARRMASMEPAKKERSGMVRLTLLATP
jgi:hypothetical protein